MQTPHMINKESQLSGPILAKRERNPSPHPAQLQAIEQLDSDLLVAAGAGSGKTWVLTERYMEMLLHGARPSEIVAITFTELAASEMKRRVRSASQSWMESISDLEQKRYFRTLYNELEQGMITTIHGFCSRLLHQYPLESGIGPNVQVLEPIEADTWLDAAIEEAIYEVLRQNPAALSILYAAWGGSRGLQDACASAYTAILTYDYAWDQIVNDTRASLKRLGEEVGDLLDEIERIAKAVVQPEFYALSEGKKVPAYVTDMGVWLESWDAVKDNLHAWDGIVSEASSKQLQRISKFWRKSGSDGLKDALDRLKELIEEINLRRAAPDMMERVETFVGLLQDVDARYQQKKDAEQAIDFHDLERLTARMLANHPAVANRLKKQLRFVMVDEFQDTNRLQTNILSAIAGEGSPVRLFLVGDGKQSIYKFRGADVDVFQDTETQYGERANGVVEMSVNYRTQSGVIDYINDFFAGCMKAPEKSRGVKQVRFAPLEAARQSDTERACVEVFVHDPGEHGDGRRSEADAIARRIRQLVEVEQAPIVYQKDDQGVERPHPVRYGDIALLFSATTHLSVYEFALQQHGIPYLVEKGRQFYRKQEVTDILTLLMMLEDPAHEIALAAWLRSPFVAISDETLYRLTRNGRLRDVWLPGHAAKASVAKIADVLQDATVHERDRVILARERLERWRHRMSVSSWTAFLREILDETGYWLMLLGQFGGEQKYANVQKLLELADTQERDQGRSLSDFCRFLMEMQADGVSETEAQLGSSGSNDAGAVRLMTVHASKGLEFPVVILPDLGRSLVGGGRAGRVCVKPGVGIGLKGYAAVDKSDEGESGDGLYRMIAKEESIRDSLEEQRKLYVAMTRARDYLMLVATRPSHHQDCWLRWVLNHLNCEKWDLLEDGVHECGDPAVQIWVNCTPPAVDVDNGDSEPPWKKWLDHGPEGIFSESGSADESLHQSSSNQSQQGVPLSASALMTYRDCARKYYYRHVFRLPEATGESGWDMQTDSSSQEDAWSDEAEDSVTPQTSFSIPAHLKGTLVHRICERLMPGDDVRSVVTDVLIGEGQADTDQFQATVEELVRLVTPYAKSEWLQIDSKREQEFHLRIGQATYHGFMDMIVDEPDGTLTLIDFKTNRIASEQDLLTLTEQYTVQTRLYTLAAQALFQKKVTRSLLFFLDQGSIVDIDVSDEVLRNTQNALMQTSEQIASKEHIDDFQLTDHRSLCGACGYRILCGRDHFDSHTSG